MPRLSGTRDGHVQGLTVPTAAGDLHLQYVAERITRDDIAAVTDAQALGAVALQDATAVYLAKVIVGWDLTDDDDQPLPVTADNMAALPVFLTVAISTAIGEAMRPPGSARPSADGS